ncbi:hypothetical protein [Anabaena catenula]|nr:hypothetical protein [Anabaena catenula]
MRAATAVDTNIYEGISERSLTDTCLIGLSVVILSITSEVIYSF